MQDRPAGVGTEAASARRARDKATQGVAQALHEAQCARIRAGVLDAGGAYEQGLMSWERAHDAGQRASAWQEIHDQWCAILEVHVPVLRRSDKQRTCSSFPHVLAS